MINTLKESLWKQFGASIQMLNNAIQLWPEKYWYTDKHFFYNSYHCLLFLDYYLSIPPNNYSSLLPFTLTAPGNIQEAAIDDLVPNRIYSKEELLSYLQQSFEKCRLVIDGLTAEKLRQQWINQPDELAASSTMQFSVLDILLYNLRHVQHHAAQLNLLLRQRINSAPDFVSEVKIDL